MFVKTPDVYTMVIVSLFLQLIVNHIVEDRGKNVVKTKYISNP